VIRRISTKAHFVSAELLDVANANFGVLLQHPDFREDALQELRMVERFGPADRNGKEAEAHRALAWLSYHLGVTPVKPLCRKPNYAPLPMLEEGTFLADLQRVLDAERSVA
jgi:hypothetical protein